MPRQHRRDADEHLARNVKYAAISVTKAIITVSSMATAPVLQHPCQNTCPNTAGITEHQGIKNGTAAASGQPHQVDGRR